MRNANKAVREKEAQSARVAVKPEKKTRCRAKRNGGEAGNAEGPKLSGETVGIDVGDRFSQFCRSDVAGEILEEARLHTNTASIEKHFSKLPPAVIALEAGTHSGWRRFDQFANLSF